MALHPLEVVYPEGKLRQLPRLYRAFFREVKFRGSMESFIADFLRAKARPAPFSPTTASAFHRHRGPLGTSGFDEELASAEVGR